MNLTARDSISWLIKFKSPCHEWPSAIQGVQQIDTDGTVAASDRLSAENTRNLIILHLFTCSLTLALLWDLRKYLLYSWHPVRTKKNWRMHLQCTTKLPFNYVECSWPFLNGNGALGSVAIYHKVTTQRASFFVIRKKLCVAINRVLNLCARIIYGSSVCPPTDPLIVAYN